MRELVYYIGTGLDGRISGPNDDVGAFLHEGDHMEVVLDEYADALPTHALEALGLTPPGSTFDTVLMGWNTYAVGLPAIDSPYQHLRQIVFSRTPGRAVGKGVTLTDRDPLDVVRGLKREDGADIWLCGGGRLAASLAPEIDRLILKVQPLTLSEGPPLFDGNYAARTWRPVSTRAFGSGVTIASFLAA